MTTNIGKDDRFLGYPAIKLRDVLTIWERGKKTPNLMSQNKTLGLPTNVCAAMLSEAHQRGFMEFDTYGQLALSNAGRAVAWASAKKRSSKAQAGKVLDEILENATRLSKDENAPIVIDQIWVFGSYLNPDRKDVGDLDIAYSTKLRAFAEGMRWDEVNTLLDTRYPGVIPDSIDPYRQDSHWVKRMLFGKRRNPLISSSSVETLKSLHQPCRIVFDDSKGGVIEAVDFPHHPDSTQRGSEIRDKLVMPDLSTNLGKFELSSARIYMSTRNMFEGNSCVIGYDRMTDEDFAKLDDFTLDGQRSFAFIIDDKGGRAIFHVGRKVEFDQDVWRYHMSIETVQMPDRYDMEYYTARMYAECIGGFFGADVLRLADRRAALGLDVTINCDLELAIPTLHANEFIDQMQNETACLLAGNPSSARLPEDYMHGIDIYWCGEYQFGFDELHAVDRERVAPGTRY